jgi:hypothetical protein
MSEESLESDISNMSRPHELTTTRRNMRQPTSRPQRKKSSQSANCINVVIDFGKRNASTAIGCLLNYRTSATCDEISKWSFQGQAERVITMRFNVDDGLR